MGRINKALHEMYDKCHTWDVLEAAVSDIPEESLTDNISDDTPTNDNPAEE